LAAPQAGRAPVTSYEYNVRATAVSPLERLGGRPSSHATSSLKSSPNTVRRRGSHICSVKSTLWLMTTGNFGSNGHSTPSARFVKADGLSDDTPLSVLTATSVWPSCAESRRKRPTSCVPEHAHAGVYACTHACRERVGVRACMLFYSCVSVPAPSLARMRGFVCTHARVPPMLTQTCAQSCISTRAPSRVLRCTCSPVCGLTADPARL